jgi:hypothetical protein
VQTDRRRTAFQSVIELQSICLRVSGAVAPSAPAICKDPPSLPQFIADGGEDGELCGDGQSPFGRGLTADSAASQFGICVAAVLRLQSHAERNWLQSSNWPVK